MKKDLISIILPNYNHSPFLEKRLDSIFNQTYKNYEIILLDDCSRDNSISKLDSVSNNPKVSHYVKNNINSGSPFRQWQRGIELAQGDYIWIAESDDFCDYYFLEKVLNYKEALGKPLDIIYAQSIDIDVDENEIYHRIKYTENFEPNIWSSNFVTESSIFIKTYLKNKNVIPNASAVIFKRSLLKNVCFREIIKMKMCGDWLFWIMLMNKSLDVGFLAEDLNYFRNHSAVTRNHFSLESYKLRLKEESILRSYMEKRVNFKIRQRSEIKKLYLKWIKLFPIKAFLSKEIYRILIPNYRLLFFSAYLKSKMQKL